MRSAALAILSAVLATVLTLLLTAETREPPVVAPPTVSAAEWNALRAEVESLRAAAERPAPATKVEAADATRSAVPAVAEPKTPAPGELAKLRHEVRGQGERIHKLEDSVRALERRALSVEPVPNSVDAIRKALDDKNLYGYPLTTEMRNRRMELMERMLALAPTDPKAATYFRLLFGDYISTGQLQRSEALLEQMRGPLQLSSWDLTSRRANLASLRRRPDEARRLLAGVVNDPAASESNRASARFRIAHSYQQAGDYDRAIALYQALIRSFPDPPPAAVKSSVGGAKAMIEKIRGWQKAAQRK